MSSPTHKLRYRVLGVMFLVFVAALISFLTVLERLVTDSFANLEQANMARDAARVRSLFEANTESLRAVSGDWAIWNDTYDFVAGRKPDYPRANLSPGALAVIGVDFMFFFDEHGGVYYAVANDPETGERIHVPESLTKKIVELKATAPPSNDPRGTRYGYVALPDGTAAVVLEGVSTNDGTARSGGMLAVGRYLDDEAVSYVGRMAKLNVKADTPHARAALLPSSPQGRSETPGKVYTDTSNPQTIVAWSTVTGLDGRPGLFYTVTEDRTGMRRAEETVRYVGFGLMFFVVVFGLMMGVTMEVLVMRRLTRLHDEVLELSRSDVNNRKVTVDGDDEIAELAVALNRNFDGLAEAEAALKHAADHDYLTGLANRRRLEEDMEKALAESKRTGEPVAYVALDLDGFKAINDTRGHHCGDAVLGWFADLLRSEVRVYSTVARVGGDEFAIMLPHAGEWEAAVVADRLLHALCDRLCDVCEGEPLQIDASVGIAVAPLDGTNIGDLGRAADAAMYHTKAARIEDEEATA